MAAVLCLMFLPALMAVGFMVGTTLTEGSGGALLTMLTFAILAGGLVMGTMRLARDWEEG